MVLHREYRQIAVADALHSPVVQIFMPKTGDITQRCKINGKAVVLCRDFNLAGLHIHNRQVGAMIAERQLDSPAPQGQTEQLMTEADTEDRFFTDQLPDLLLHLYERFRITGTVGEEDSVRVHGQSLFGRERGRNHRHITAGIHQTAQNVELDAEIVGYNLVFQRSPVNPGIARFQIPHPLGPVIRHVTTDSGGQIQTGHTGDGLRFGNNAFVVEIDR